MIKMCGFYDDNQKIKKGDSALYKGKTVNILLAKHIKENKTMDITIEYIDTKIQETINIPYKTAGYGFVKTNIMGSQIVKGFECKPKKLDPNKPIMHYKTLLYICEDERCKNASKNIDKAKELREIVKELDLEKGQNRIKISRSLCQGACRYKQVVQINENTNANGYAPNNGIWLKHTHKYSKQKWKELFIALKENKNIQTNSKFDTIDMRIYI